MHNDKIIKTDILVAGSGIAGIKAALKASKEGLDVFVISKTKECVILTHSFVICSFKYTLPIDSCLLLVIRLSLIHFLGSNAPRSACSYSLYPPSRQHQFGTNLHHVPNLHLSR